MEEYEPWMTKPEDENVVVEIKSATFGWNEVGSNGIQSRTIDETLGIETTLT